MTAKKTAKPTPKAKAVTPVSFVPVGEPVTPIVPPTARELAAKKGESLPAGVPVYLWKRTA